MGKQRWIAAATGLSVLSRPSLSESPTDFEHSALYQLWRERRGERKFPARRDFDVQDLAPWLGDLELIEIVECGERTRYRYRLVGTNITQIDGIDATGHFADEVFTDNYPHVICEYEQVLRTGAPCLRQRRASPSRLGFDMVYHKLVLPLASDGANIDMLLVHLYDMERLGHDG